MGLCLAATALAIGLHIGSYHTDIAGNFNNVNPGIYGTYNSYTMGTYYNSNRAQTVYAGKIYPIDDQCRYDLTVGIASGYVNNITPYVALGINFDSSNIVKDSQIKLKIVPSIRHNYVNGTLQDNTYGGVLHITFEKKF